MREKILSGRLLESSYKAQKKEINCIFLQMDQMVTFTFEVLLIVFFAKRSVKIIIEEGIFIKAKYRLYFYNQHKSALKLISVHKEQQLDEF